MATTEWVLDPTHSDVLFSVKHLGISTVRGHFDSLSGTASGDPDDPSTLKLDVQIDVASLTTGDEKRDAHVKSADFLDAAAFPHIAYSARGAKPEGPSRYRLEGDLTIKGATKRVDLEVEGPSPETKDPWGNTRLGASASAVVHRKEFGVTWNQVLEAGALLVGEEVKVTIDVQFVKQP